MIDIKSNKDIDIIIDSDFDLFYAVVQAECPNMLESMSTATDEETVKLLMRASFRQGAKARLEIANKELKQKGL